ncbi:MAG: hypothetical protein ABIB98_03195 [bacterium]
MIKGIVWEVLPKAKPTNPQPNCVCNDCELSGTGCKDPLFAGCPPPPKLVERSKQMRRRHAPKERRVSNAVKENSCRGCPKSPDWSSWEKVSSKPCTDSERCYYYNTWLSKTGFRNLY